MSFGQKILKQWNSAKKLPLGKDLFNFILGRTVPYSASIGAKVQELTPGHVRINLQDRRKVRNHLHSIHAIALMNLGELATGLAGLTALENEAKSIVVKLSMEYHKKARGKLLATADVEPFTVLEKSERIIEGRITDEENDLVAVCQATWLYAPLEE